MLIGVPKERLEGERRVAITPKILSRLNKHKFQVLIEKGAGDAAGFSDAEYQEHDGVSISSRSELFSKADIITCVRWGYDEDDIKLLRKEQILIGMLNPHSSAEDIMSLANLGISAFSLELMPRISRSQNMDALSSQATVAGYKAALLGADQLPKMYPMMVTPAGTITPAHVLVIGAGVAGLQAVATSLRLGAVVHAYDIRPEVKEQVESLGAKFLEETLIAEENTSDNGYAREMGKEFNIRQQKLLTNALTHTDVVITTAEIPGKKAPVLITEEMLKSMKAQSIIIDLAAESGGNCEVTKAGKTLNVHGIKVFGVKNIASSMGHHASDMYAHNIAAFLLHSIKDGKFQWNFDDVIINDTLLTYQGDIYNERVKHWLGLSEQTQKT
ncbi:MAG: NAD(P) transhydrogenase subunit alpha [Chlamydiales bacterium]|jgi:NAD(P) transhydrogenase subunit alpha